MLCQLQMQTREMIRPVIEKCPQPLTIAQREKHAGRSSKFVKHLLNLIIKGDIFHWLNLFNIFIIYIFDAIWDFLLWVCIVVTFFVLFVIVCSNFSMGIDVQVIILRVRILFQFFFSDSD